MSPTATATKPKPVDADILKEAPPAQPLVPVAAVPSLAAQLSRSPNVAAALVKAVRDCRAVAHDARNEHHKYDYTSSEAILTAARDALSNNGLAIIPVSQQVNGHEREGPDRYELASTRLLVHVSGESVVCTSAWPITLGAGRPLDKATAAADTLSLRYFLRTLLQIPCVDLADEVNARDDSKVKAPAAKPEPQKSAAKNTSSAAPKTARQLGFHIGQVEPDLVRQGIVDPGELSEQAKSFADEQGYPPDREAWTEPQVKATHAWLRDWLQRRRAELANRNAGK